MRRPKYTRTQMKELLATVARYVVEVMGLECPLEEVVESAYDLLWYTDDMKFATEIYLDRHTVEIAICDAQCESWDGGEEDEAVAF